MEKVLEEPGREKFEILCGIITRLRGVDVSFEAWTLGVFE